MAETLIQIKSPYFVAGATAQHGYIVRAAPIIHYSIGWTTAKLLGYCRSKGWQFDHVSIPNQPKKESIPSRV